MDIILYTTGCPRCAVLKKKLDMALIQYTQNFNTDEMLKLGIESVPVLSVDGELLNFTEANKWIKEVMANECNN